MGFVSSTAIMGLDVAFSAGTSLRVQAVQSDADMAARGVDLTDASIVSESTIPITVDMAGVVPGAGGRISAAVCTVPESAMPEYENLFVVGSMPRGYKSALTWVPNPDSTRTLRVVILSRGFVVDFR